MLIGGTLQRLLGIKPAIILGSLCVSLSTLAGYWTINNYFVLCATYGLIFGLGVGLAYSSPMTAGLACLPFLKASNEVATEQPRFGKWSNCVRFWFRIFDLQFCANWLHQSQKCKTGLRSNRNNRGVFLPRGNCFSYSPRFFHFGGMLSCDASDRIADDIGA